MKINKGVVALGLAGMFAICGVTTLLANASDFQDPKARTNVPVAESAGPGAIVGKEAAKATRSVKPKPAPATIGEGTHEVGRTVKPGKYTTTGAVVGVLTLCYWDVRTGSETGDIGAQGVRNKADAPGIVTLRKGQFFTTSGCETWTPVK